MASQINSNNIDGAYPVAGQDNDSQGFRDNFTNIKTNFNYAGAEITDLQNKAVLKAALTGTTLNNNMNNSIISNVQLAGVSTPRSALGSVTTATLNLATSSFYTIGPTVGSVTLAFSNWPTAGQSASVRLQITVNSISHTLILPSAVSIGTSNLQGYSSNVITFNKTGTYTFEFSSSDGGTTIAIFDMSRNHDPIYLTSAEDLAAAAAASLTKTTSYFSTSAAETATLAAGVEGQVKIFAMTGDLGDMVITVTNAGWTSNPTGTITFGDLGDACTLLYINAKWYCVGNNGCAFA